MSKLAAMNNRNGNVLKMTKRYNKELLNIAVIRCNVKTTHTMPRSVYVVLHGKIYLKFLLPYLTTEFVAILG